MSSSPSPKRRKITRACDCCRVQKKRCTGTIPCDSCVRNAKKCSFLASYTRGRAVTPPPSATSGATPVTPSSSVAPTFPALTSPKTVRHAHTASPNSSIAKGTLSESLHHQRASVAIYEDDQAWDTTHENQPPATSNATAGQDAVSSPASDEVLADGNFVGPGSAHSWLKQAWSCLGRVRQHVVRLQSSQAGSSASGTHWEGPIFSHGDKALREDLMETTRLPHLSASTLDLIISTYFDRGLATYRFLHRPTVTGWLQDLQDRDNISHYPAVRTAIVLLLLAVGASYLSEKEKESLPKPEAELLRNEVLFYRALSKLKEERGAPSVESVQARMMQVHYLLTSSRPNRAWYAFGTVIQLVFALGLHQRSYARQNIPGLAREMRRRAFWSVYKTDKSLSIALGRPSLMREECITQDLPEAVNDEQLFPDHIEPQSDDDCLLEADILQIKLSRIVGRSMREYYETDDNALVQLITSNNEKLADWKAQLPPFLSGTGVKPSSLIPVLRRQATVLKLFHLHTVIFINRPLLLKSFSNTWSSSSTHHQHRHQHPNLIDQQVQSSIDQCIEAASEIAKQAVQFNLEGQAFRAFWFSQNMTFNAVSILYLNALRLLLQRQALAHSFSHASMNKSSSSASVISTTLTDKELALITTAEEAQHSLTNASEYNAPGQRYGIVLEQLRLEVKAHIDSAASGVLLFSPDEQGGNDNTTNYFNNNNNNTDDPDIMSSYRRQNYFVNNGNNNNNGQLDTTYPTPTSTNRSGTKRTTTHLESSSSTTRNAIYSPHNIHHHHHHQHKQQQQNMPVHGHSHGNDFQTSSIDLETPTSFNDASTFWPQFDGLPLGFDDWLGMDFLDPGMDPGG